MRAGKLKRWTAAASALVSGGLDVVRGIRRNCVICGRRVPAFLPWRGGWESAPPLMKALHMVGSDLDCFACPRCGCNDRDRHLRLYLERTGLAGSLAQARILHFAPEPHLVSWIASFGPALHVLGDLFPTNDSVLCIDLEAIPFPDNHFDWVIANHVLEHVADLERATDEIARVLRPEGTAILQTPWCKGLESTIDDPTVVSADARLQLYGQEDHVRLFGRDVYRKIGAGGLHAEPIEHAAVLADLDARTYGINPEEELMLFRARAKAG